MTGSGIGMGPGGSCGSGSGSTGRLGSGEVPGDGPGVGTGMGPGSMPGPGSAILGELISVGTARVRHRLPSEHARMCWGNRVQGRTVLVLQREVGFYEVTVDDAA